MKHGLIKLEMINTEVGSHTMVRLKHPDGEVVFDVSEYDKAFKDDGSAVFNEINDYFATLTPDEQIKIATIFHQLAMCFATTPDPRQLKLSLQEILKQLYSVIQYPKVLEWVRFHVRPRCPATMRDDYIPSDPPDRRRTYIYRDYVEVVALAVLLRPMIPIWGEYILRNKRVAGTDYKELQAIKILFQTGITELPPSQRLLAYIEATTSYEDPVFSSVVQGLGTDERAEWLLALNLIRRVATGEIDSPDPNSNIITNCYNYTKTKLEQLAKKSNIKRKDKPQRGPEDDNVSFLEMYKVKEKVSHARIAPIEVYTEDPLGAARRVDETIPTDLVNICLDSIKQLEGLPTYRHQVVLAQWVLAKVIPPRGIESLTKVSILRVIAVTQAILWHWGFYDLAALVTACPYPIDDDQVLSNIGGKTKIPKHLVDELNIMFPHHVEPGSKADRAKVAAGKIPNEAVKSLENYYELIMQHDWELYAPQALQDKTSKYAHSRRLTAPADIRAQLAELIIRFSR